MDLLIVLATAVSGFLLYFLPSVVSNFRRHHNHVAIVIFNLLLGWTGLGWVLALVWACTATYVPEGDDA